MAPASGRTYFTRCYVEGCNADVVIEDELLKILRAGKDAVFAFKESPDRKTALAFRSIFPVSGRGTTPCRKRFAPEV